MAKRSEDGIEYFPMNTDIISNPKIKLVVAEFGSKTTWPVLLSLYCKIYRDKGYWIDWCDEDSKLLFAQDECKVELSVVNEVVNGCIRRSLFDKRVFDLFGVLTSDRIQENYLVAKRRNKSAKFISEFRLISDDVYKTFQNVNIIDLNVNILSKKGIILKQKKKEIIEGEGEGDSGVPPTHTPEQISLFKNFQAFILKDAPNVGKMKEPFTIDEYLKLKAKFNSEAIKDMLKTMHNYKPLLQKNVCAYLTFINWSKREYANDDLKPLATGGKLSGLVASINEQEKIK